MHKNRKIIARQQQQSRQSNRPQTAQSESMMLKSTGGLHNPAFQASLNQASQRNIKSLKSVSNLRPSSASTYHMNI